MKYSESLKKNKDFQYIYRKGKSYANKYLVMYVLENGTSQNRLGISVSKKVGNSVVRNRARRLMKESYRQIFERLAVGYDIIFIARKTIVNLKCADVKKSIEAATRRSGILKK